MISNEELNRRFVEKIGRGKGGLCPKELDWVTGWREVADLTKGLGQEHPDFEMVHSYLNECDQAFFRGNWEGFRMGTEKIKGLLKEKP